MSKTVGYARVSTSEKNLDRAGYQSLRACKTKLAFDRYQIRSAKGIKRFWILTALAYFFGLLSIEVLSFSAWI